MKKFLRTAAFLVVIIALLVLVVMTVSAATKTKSACTSAGGGPKACLKGTFEYSGNNVRGKSKWVTKSYSAGWTIQTTRSPYFSPTGWTGGRVTEGASFRWYYNGAYKGSRSCAITCDAINGGLSCSKYCK